ncbi:MAG: hypothetical protein GY750_05590 [Lentisphaerae bacterium]|nr:hypothetical protein [Lentisphaerota bacterium]MCP4100881.1 hypothetical protein [Lentisphaerota bacterium]
MFTYGSVYYVPFEGEYAKNIHITNPDWYQPNQFKQHYIYLREARMSIPDNTRIPALRINYNLADDVPSKYQRTIREIADLVKDIQLPAKIYINAHGSEGSSRLTQKYLKPDGTTKYNHLYYKQLGSILKNAIPPNKRSKIVFHFACCEANKYARLFTEYIHAKGWFRQCYSVSYDSVVHSKCYKVKDDTFYMRDISTHDRASGKRYLHHRDEPDLPDNKKLSFWDGTVHQVPYRKWIQDNMRWQGEQICQDKNFWLLDKLILLDKLTRFIKESSQTQKTTYSAHFFAKLDNLIHEQLGEISLYTAYEARNIIIGTI